MSTDYKRLPDHKKTKILTFGLLVVLFLIVAMFFALGGMVPAR